MKPKQRRSPRLSNKPTGIASKRQPFSRSATRPCSIRFASTESLKRRDTTSSPPAPKPLSISAESRWRGTIGPPPCAWLRNRERDRSRLGIASGRRGDSDGVIASRGSADRRLGRTLTARWNQQKHAEQGTECQNSGHATPAGIAPSAEQH